MLAYFIDLERTSTKYLRTIYYRQESAKQQTATIKCTRKPKISIFAPQGRLIAPIRVKFGMAEHHIGPLGPAKFKLNRCTGVGTRPQKLTISRSEPFERFLKLSGFFLCMQILCRSVSNLTWFASEVTELLLRNRASIIYPEFFRAPYRKNMRWVEKSLPSFTVVSTSSTTMQSLGRSNNARRL